MRRRRFWKYSKSVNKDWYLMFFNISMNIIILQITSLASTLPLHPLI